MSFSKTIHAQISADGGEAGARVRKNKTRNAQAAPVKPNLRSKGVKNVVELKPLPALPRIVSEEEGVE